MILAKLKAIFNYSIPVKLIISAFVTALGGTTYFAIISNYAIYYYSIQQGFRLPSEGSPFIVIAVATITFIVLITAGLIFFLLFSLNNLAGKKFGQLYVLYGKLHQWAERKHHDRTKWFITYLQKSAEKPISISFTFTISFILTGISLLILIFTPIDPIPPVLYWILPLLAAFYPLMVVLPFVEKKLRLVICTVFSLVYIFLTPTLAFNPTLQSDFLAAIKYGGDTPVVLHFDQNRKQASKLTFRSSQSVFVKSGDDGMVSEFPISALTSVDYLPVGQAAKTTR